MKQLSSYRAQLQQVEAALSTDQENEDLLKLQKDLQVRLIIVPLCNRTSLLGLHLYADVLPKGHGTSFLYLLNGIS